MAFIEGCPHIRSGLYEGLPIICLAFTHEHSYPLSPSLQAGVLFGSYCSVVWVCSENLSPETARKNPLDPSS